MTNSERQAKFRAEQAAKGLVQLTVWVPAQEAPAVKVAAGFLCSDKKLRIAVRGSNGQLHKGKL